MNEEINDIDMLDQGAVPENVLFCSCGEVIINDSGATYLSWSWPRVKIVCNNCRLEWDAEFVLETREQGHVTRLDKPTEKLWKTDHIKKVMNQILRISKEDHQCH